tara:strand:- start:427 stop:834 length:408 start_codon:yes stop_codon:yes gene_type:complete
MATQQELTYFNQACRKAIQATVQEVFAKAIEKCPVKLGNLRGSAAITKADPVNGSFTIAFNSNDNAPYAQLIEEGGTVPQHYKKSKKTGNGWTVLPYTVEGQFFIKEALDEVFSGQYNMTVINANLGSSGYYINV